MGVSKMSFLVCAALVFLETDAKGRGFEAFLFHTREVSGCQKDPVVTAHISDVNIYSVGSQRLKGNTSIDW